MRLDQFISLFVSMVSDVANNNAASALELSIEQSC